MQGQRLKEKQRPDNKNKADKLVTSPRDQEIVASYPSLQEPFHSLCPQGFLSLIKYKCSRLKRLNNPSPVVIYNSKKTLRKTMAATHAKWKFRRTNEEMYPYAPAIDYLPYYNCLRFTLRQFHSSSRAHMTESSLIASFLRVSCSSLVDHPN